MGALTVKIDQTFSSAGNRTMVLGTLTWSSSYATGGDTVDPMQLGLDILDALIVGPALNATPIAFVPAVTSAFPAKSTMLSGGTPPVKVAAMTVPDPIPAADIGTGGAGLIEASATADLHTFSAPFIALGV